MNLPLRAENGTKHAAKPSARSWLLLEILTVAGAVIFYFGVLRPSLARTELNTRLLKDLKVCGANADLDVIRRLLQQGANPNAAVCKMRIERGADIHAVDSRNGSIIIYSRSNDVVELLLGQGLDINAREKDGSTLLMVSAAVYAGGDPHSFAARAAAGSRVPDLDFLLKQGADPNVRTKAGLTPLNALKSLV